MSCLQPKKTGQILHLEFEKNWVTFHNTSFFERTKKSGITYKKEKKKTPKVISVLKEDRQALGLFASKFTHKNVRFKQIQAR